MLSYILNLFIQKVVMYRGQHNLINVVLSETGLALSAFSSFDELFAVDIYSSLSSGSYLLIIKPDDTSTRGNIKSTGNEYSSMDDCNAFWLCCDSYPFVPRFENNEGITLVIRVTDDFFQNNGVQRNEDGYFISRNESFKMKLRGVSDLLSLLQMGYNDKRGNRADQLWLTANALEFLGHFIGEHYRMQQN